MSDHPTQDPGETSNSSRGAGPTFTGFTEIAGLTPADPDRDPLLGNEIGGVTIIRLIAEGGMGRVYEGKQEKPGRTVAVKVMRPGLTSPSLLKRFEYEAEVLARLQHPGIAHIYSVGVYRLGSTTAPYFVMEYIANARTLTKYADELKLPIRQRLDLFRSVCEAVAHGHQRGVIHRDLKPSNILVDATGQPKVIDFGVARATDSDMALTTMQTDVGQLIGTLEYMSPEQFDGDPNVIDVRSDVYALGVVLYELLTGRPPYDVKKKAIYEVMQIVKEENPTPLSAFNRALRGDVAVIAGKCLEKDRGRRYPSAAELGADVGRHLSGDPITASPPGFFDGLLRLARRHKGASVAIAGVFVSLVVGVVGIAFFAKSADHARKIAETALSTAQDAKVTADDRQRQAEAAEASAKQEREIAAQRLYEANLLRVKQSISDRNYAFAKALFVEMTAGRDRDVLPIELACIGVELEQSFAICDGHQGPVEGVVFSPDGTRLVTWSGDGTARLWEASLGKNVATFECQDEYVTAGVFSPDGSVLATGGFLGSVRLWDVTNGKQLAKIKGPAGEVCSLAYNQNDEALRVATCISRGIVGGGGGNGPVGSAEERDETEIQVWEAYGRKEPVSLKGLGRWVYSLAFSPDGEKIATRGQDNNIRLWDAETGAHSATLEGHSGFISGLAFSPDSITLATGAADQTARLWDVHTGKQLAVLEAGGRGPTQVALSHDGKKLAAGGDAGPVQLWDVASREKLAELKGDVGCNLVAFSPDNSTLAATYSDGTLRLWSVADGKQQAVLRGHTGKINSLAFSPKGARLATGGQDATARLWSAANGAQEALLHVRGGVFRQALVFSPDGTKLATGPADKAVLLWDVATCKLLAAFDSGSLELESLAFSPDSRRLVARGLDTTLQSWDISTGKSIGKLSAALGEKRVLSTRFLKSSFSADYKTAAAIGLDNTARLFDISTGKQLALFEGRRWALENLVLSPDGSKLATRDSDATVRLRDLASGKELFLLEPQSPSSHLLGFSPDCTKLATVGKNGSVQLWDASSGQRLAELPGSVFKENLFAFSSDGSKLATGGPDATAQLWDVVTGQLLAAVEAFEGFPVGTDFKKFLMAFSPNGTLLVTRSADNTLRLWDASSGNARSVLRGHSREITEFTFNPDGTRLATTSSDNTVRIWDPQSGKQLLQLTCPEGGLTQLTFSPDGTTLATRCGDSCIRLWGISNAQIYQARLDTSAIERRLEERVSTWLRGGRDAAAERLREARAVMTSDEYRVACNMILSRAAGLSED